MRFLGNRQSKHFPITAKRKSRSHTQRQLRVESLEDRLVLSANPFLHIHDSTGELGVVDVNSGQTTVIGDMGPAMFDIAFSPTGELYAVTASTLYSVDPATAVSTPIGSHGVSGANALVFDAMGTLYAMGTSSSLYTLNTSTAQSTNLGSVGHSSAGDLAFVDGDLYLASSSSQLVQIDLNGGITSTVVGAFGVSSVFGLATPDNATLYATAGTSVYEVDLQTGSATQTASYAGMGLGSAYGTSFYSESGGEEPAGTISGVKYHDINGNGIRDQSLIQGNPPHVVFVIDISPSADQPFQGSPVGDVNGDGNANTRYDAELAAFLALNQELVDEGFGNIADVSIVTFGGTASSLDMNSVISGNQLSTNPLTDANNNGIRDVEEILTGLTSNIGATDFEAALQESLAVLSGVGAAGEDGNVVFLSDGDQNNGGPFDDEADAIRNRGSSLRAFGVGTDAVLSKLQDIDPEAQIFSTTDELLGIFGGLESQTINYQEPGLPGWTIYLDDNNNGLRDAGETSTTTNANGEYGFFGLPAGTYTVAEEQQAGWTQTAPLTTQQPNLVGDYDFEDGTAGNQITGIGALPDLNNGSVSVTGGSAFFNLETDFLELPTALGNSPFTIAIDATYDVPPMGDLAIAVSQQGDDGGPAGDPTLADFSLLQTGFGVYQAAYYNAEGTGHDLHNGAFDGQRHTYGLTWDGSNWGNFFDGSLQTVAVGGSLPDIDGAKLRFGAQDPAHAFWGEAGMTGEVHGIRIFDLALTVNELQQAFNNSSLPGPHFVTLGTDEGASGLDFGNRQVSSGPEVTVTGRGYDIADDSTFTSTLDGTSFGNVPLGGSMSRTFIVRNDGDATLDLSGLVAPSGFMITEGLDGSIAPGASDSFTVAIDSSTAGTKSGQISFGTNDVGENPFNFTVSGNVGSVVENPLPGDYDTDSDVDGFDFLAWQRQLGNPATPSGSGPDGNQDGTINAGDLEVWQDNYGNHLRTAADARDLALGNLVTISGVVTSTVDLVNFSTAKIFYVQDQTGGFGVFGTDERIDELLTGVSVGDSVSVTGVVGEFNGIFQLRDTNGALALEVTGSPGVPTPTPLAVSDFANFSAVAEAVEGTLVSLSNVNFTQTGFFDGPASYTVTDGINQATVRVSTGELDLEGTPIPTGPVDLVGIASQFDPSDPPNGTPGTGYQLLLRSTSDISTSSTFANSPSLVTSAVVELKRPQGRATPIALSPELVDLALAAAASDDFRGSSRAKDPLRSINIAETLVSASTEPKYQDSVETQPNSSLPYTFDRSEGQTSQEPDDFSKPFTTHLVDSELS